MNKGARTLFLVVVSLLAIIIVWNAVSGNTPLALGQNKITTLNQTEFSKYVKDNQVKSAKWQQADINGELKDGSKFTVKVAPVDSPSGSELNKLMVENGVPFVIEGPPPAQIAVSVLSMFLLPVLLFVFVWLFFIRPSQAGGNQAMNFGRSKARRVGELSPKVTFDDVAGIDEAKTELYEIVDFLKNTKRYSSLGAKIPKGVLLTGPPGCGKTHLARAIAGEAGVPFFHISGSDFVEMFVGVGAARVRDLFETAKAHRPCLLFVDEIDAVGRQRGTGLGGGHDEREQTLNQLLVEMDGFEPNTGVIVIAATNRPDILDPALLRPGRFDRRIVVDPPDARGREMILKIHAKGKPLSEDVDLKTIAKRSPGFTGADLANSLNEAALLAARRNQVRVSMMDIEEAIDRVMMGPQRKSRVIEPKEREIIAYHEAGHAVIGELLENCDPVHKVTILPRGMSLGSTWSLPEKDTHITSKTELIDDITMTLGGRVAEELAFDEQYTGSYSDLQAVTRLARAMVTEYGMSEKLGTRAIGRRGTSPFLGREISEDRDYSEEVARIVDAEVHDIVARCRQRAYDVLTSNREKLDRLVAALLERESLGREDFLLVLDGKPLPDLPEVELTTQVADEPTAQKEESNQPNTQSRLEPGTA